MIVVQAAKGREAGLTWEGEKVGSEGGGGAGGLGAGPLGLGLGLEKHSLPIDSRLSIFQGNFRCRGGDGDEETRECGWASRPQPPQGIMAAAALQCDLFPLAHGLHLTAELPGSLVLIDWLCVIPAVSLLDVVRHPSSFSAGRGICYGSCCFPLVHSVRLLSAYHRAQGRWVMEGEKIVVTQNFGPYPAVFCAI